MLMTGVILVAKPNKLFQVSHLKNESNKNLTTYFTGLCLALIAAFCGALIGITTKVLKGKKVIYCSNLSPVMNIIQNLDKKR